MTSAEIRSQLVEALKLDFVGPGNERAFAHKLLPDAPSRSRLVPPLKWKLAAGMATGLGDRQVNIGLDLVPREEQGIDGNCSRRMRPHGVAARYSRQSNSDRQPLLAKTSRPGVRHSV